MKQTAVEWLEEQLFKKQGKFNKSDIEQAKAMEKEQIIKAITFTIVGSNNIYDKEYPEIIYTAEQYFNETFKSKTKVK